MAILYEHPEWFKLLFAELTRREVSFEPLYVNEHAFDPARREVPYSLVVNRVSPSSYLRDHAGSILYTRQLLAYLRDLGAPVVNGYEAFALETSKALQLLLFERLGIRYPRARVVNHPSQLAGAADGLTFPVIVKPNVGGSGALMQRCESPAALREVAATGSLDLGIDHTVLVQEYLAPVDGAIVRVEVLDGTYLYAIKIFTDAEEGFNLCPADICRPDAIPGVAVARPAPLERANGASAPPSAQVSMLVEGLPAKGRLLVDGQLVEHAACDYGATAVASPGVAAPSAKKSLRIEPCTPPWEIVEGRHSAAQSRPG